MGSMFFTYRDQGGSDNGEDGTPKKKPRTIGSETVEQFPAPTVLAEHQMFERMLCATDDEFLDQINAAQHAGGEGTSSSVVDDAPVCDAVVSARLLSSRATMVEFIELSATTDATAQPYSHLMWLKLRVFRIWLFIIYAMVSVAVIIGTLIATFQVTQWWHFVALTVFLIGSQALLKVFVLNNVLSVSNWYEMPYSSWCELVKCMTVWNNNDVSQKHIYRRAMSFIQDVAVKESSSPQS